jgi:predicted TIM-barrel fold metal-dependent hydrolase
MKYMEEKQMIFSMCLADNERQIAEFQEVVSECPNLKIAIGHFGLATTKNWKNQILLARNPNVFIESGGITWLYNSEFYPFPSAVKAIREAADLVGIDKLMWGSDYPRTICAITYKMSYDFVLKSSLLTQSEKEAFLGGNAVKFYGFKDLPVLEYVKNMSE